MGLGSTWGMRKRWLSHSSEDRPCGHKVSANSFTAPVHRSSQSLRSEKRWLSVLTLRECCVCLHGKDPRVWMAQQHQSWHSDDFRSYVDTSLG